MKKIWYVVIFAIVLIFAVFYFYNSSLVYSKDNLSLSYCNKINDIDKKWNCYSEVAYAKNDSRICEKIDKTSFSIISCYTRFGLREEQINLCEGLEGDTLFGNSTRGSNDVVPYSLFCYYGFALVLKNPIICEKIPYEQKASLDRANYTFDSSPIFVRYSFRDICYHASSISGNLKNYCNNIIDLGLKQECLDFENT